MIDLYEVKKWNEYDFIQDTLPASDGTWLCSLTAGDYVKGHSYNVSSGSATRIEQTKDMLIDAKIHPTINGVCEWLNNYFLVSRVLQNNAYVLPSWGDSFFPTSLARDYGYYESDVSNYTFTGDVITGLESDVFKVGDMVTIMGALRNNVSGYVTQQSAGQITLDNPNLKDTTEKAVIFLSDIPVVVEQVIQQMINWDVFNREVTDKKSESVGNYSFDIGDIKIGGLHYPAYYTSQLEAFRRVNFVA